MTNPRRVVHQLLHTLSYGDAISGEALALKRCLTAQGFESEIFAINIHPKLKGQARFYGELSADFNGTVILHYSLGSPLNDLYRRMTAAERSLIYHNLTPAKWFAGVNPRIVSDIQAGLRELPELCEISDLLIADSNYNAAEIGQLGFRATVLELPLDPQRWDEPANAGIENIIRSAGGIHLMHVGRFAPNKCIEDIIKTFYFLHHKIEPKSRLWLVGIDIDTEIYSFALKRLVYELSLGDAVYFEHDFTDRELKALYQNAGVYTCMSEHEGFCMPVVEAMHFGVPVIAYASSALPDTVGTGGILVSDKQHAVLAELIFEVANDGELRTKLIEAGYERVKNLSYDQFSRNVSRIFTGSVLTDNVLTGNAVEHAAPKARAAQA